MEPPRDATTTARFLRDVGRRMACEQALARAATGAWLVATGILLVEVTARFVTVPDLRIYFGGLLLLLPLGRAILAVVRRAGPGAVALRAGYLANSPSLFVSLDAPRTRLAPVLLARAEAAARDSRGKIPLQIKGWTRTAALPCLICILLLIAPGRLEPTTPLHAGSLDVLARESRRASRALAGAALSEEETARAREALERLAEESLTPAEARAALREITEAARTAGGDAARMAEALRDDPLLREVARGIRTGDRDLALRALKDLARRLRENPPDAELRAAAGATLVAVATEVNDPELARLLRRIGRTLATGSGSESAEGLLALAPRVPTLPAAAHELRNVTVFLEGILEGTEAGGSGSATTDSSLTLAPRLPDTASNFAFIPGGRLREEPRHEAILRAYFGQRVR